jgi:hypothetical protein
MQNDILLSWCLHTVDLRIQHLVSIKALNDEKFIAIYTQWKLLIMITLGPVLFDNNNWLITLSGSYKDLHYLTQFIVTTFTCIKNKKIYLKNLCSVACCLFAFNSS